VRKALRSLPWVREAKVNYAAKTATVLVERNARVPGKLVEALEEAGFGGKVQPPAKKKEGRGTCVTFHVLGM